MKFLIAIALLLVTFVAEAINITNYPLVSALNNGQLITVSDIGLHTNYNINYATLLAQMRTNEPFKNVLTYGADNTGVADCTPAFNAAVQAAQGGRLVIPAGTYSFNTLAFYSGGSAQCVTGTITQPIEIVGSGNPTLKMTAFGSLPNDNSYLFNLNSSASITFAGLTFYSAHSVPALNPSTAIDIGPVPSPYVLPTNCVIRDCQFVNFGNDVGCTGVRSLVIDNCAFDHYNGHNDYGANGFNNVATAIRLFAECYDVSITHCVYDGASSVKNWLTNSSWSQRYGMENFVYGYVTGAHITDCSIHHCSQESIILQSRSPSFTTNQSGIEIANNVIDCNPIPGSDLSISIDALRGLSIDDNNVTVSGNLISGFQQGCLFFGGSNIVVSGNVFIGASLALLDKITNNNFGLWTKPIVLNGVIDATVIGNTIAFNDRRVLPISTNSANPGNVCWGLSCGVSLEHTTDASVSENRIYSLVPYTSAVTNTIDIAGIAILYGTNICLGPNLIQNTDFGVVSQINAISSNNFAAAFPGLIYPATMPMIGVHYPNAVVSDSSGGFPAIQFYTTNFSTAFNGTNWTQFSPVPFDPPLNQWITNTGQRATLVFDVWLTNAAKLDFFTDVAGSGSWTRTNGVQQINSTGTNSQTCMLRLGPYGRLALTNNSAVAIKVGSGQWVFE